MIEEVVKTFTQHEHDFENNLIIFLLTNVLILLELIYLRKKKLFTIMYQAMIKYQHIFMVEEEDSENSYFMVEEGDRENSYL